MSNCIACGIISQLFGIPVERVHEIAHDYAGCAEVTLSRDDVTEEIPADA